MVAGANLGLAGTGSAALGAAGDVGSGKHGDGGEGGVAHAGNICLVHQGLGGNESYNSLLFTFKVHWNQSYERAGFEFNLLIFIINYS